MMFKLTTKTLNFSQSELGVEVKEHAVCRKRKGETGEKQDVDFINMF